MFQLKHGKTAFQVQWGRVAVNQWDLVGGVQWVLAEECRWAQEEDYQWALVGVNQWGLVVASQWGPVVVRHLIATGLVALIRTQCSPTRVAKVVAAINQTPSTDDKYGDSKRPSLDRS